MDKILFFAHCYWEIHWMYNVIKELDGVVYTTNETTKQLCDDLNIKTTTDRENWKAVVMCNMHMGQNWEMNEYFLNTGGKSIIMQHAWDSGLNLCNKFWDHDMSKFSYYLVGCEQDYKWLGDKYDYDRVLNLGMPKLDDLHKIKNEDVDLEPIYQELGTRDFFLSIAPTDVINSSILRDYQEHLITSSPTQIVFKLHPGNIDYEQTRQSYLSQGRDFKIIADKLTDIDFIYKLIKASKGIVCIESFLSIEASLMNKPVIFHGHDSLTSDFYNKEENINQIERAPLGMSSSLGDPHFKQEQQTIANLYRCDGKSTCRVVTFLKGLYNTL
jgi:hypothetical protein